MSRNPFLGGCVWREVTERGAASRLLGQRARRVWAVVGRWLWYAILGFGFQAVGYFALAALVAQVNQLPSWARSIAIYPLGAVSVILNLVLYGALGHTVWQALRGQK